MEKELEVKVLNIDLDQVEKSIISLGGTIYSRERQINTLIDSNEKPIKSYLDAYLRIRESKDLLTNQTSTTLTLKKNLYNQNLRENIELNTGIENKEIMLNILEDLGFNKISEGFKERTSYILQGARIDLDIWDSTTYPFPYMEIEVASEEELNNIISILKIPKENISTKSIIELRKEIGLE